MILLLNFLRIKKILHITIKGSCFCQHCCNQIGGVEWAVSISPVPDTCDKIFQALSGYVWPSIASWKTGSNIPGSQNGSVLDG